MKERKFLSKEQLHTLHVSTELLQQTYDKVETRKSYSFSSLFKLNILVPIFTLFFISLVTVPFFLKDDATKPLPIKENVPRIMSFDYSSPLYSDDFIQITVEKQETLENGNVTPFIVESKVSDFSLEFSSTNGTFTELDHNIIQSLNLVSNSAYSLLYNHGNKNVHTGKNIITLTVSVPNTTQSSYKIKMIESNGNWDVMNTK